jgi:hypothetical protein
MITAALLRNVPLLAEVPDVELAVIAGRAADIHLRANDWLIQEGEVPSFFIVISGSLDVYKTIAGGERLINHYGTGEYSGEVPILLGAPAIASLRAAEPSRVCRLDQSDFRELIARCPLLNAQLLQMMATRVNGLQQLAITAPVATVTIIGHRFDLACHALRDFLTRNHVAFRWHDPRDPEARSGLSPTPQPDEAFPVVRFADEGIGIAAPPVFRGPAAEYAGTYSGWGGHMDVLDVRIAADSAGRLTMSGSFTGPEDPVGRLSYLGPSADGETFRLDDKRLTFVREHGRVTALRIEAPIDDPHVHLVIPRVTAPATATSRAAGRAAHRSGAAASR